MKLVVSIIGSLSALLILSGQAPSFEQKADDSQGNLDANSTDSNVTVLPTLQRSSQTETIKKAEVDLRHGKEGERVGAAKLLGKYPSSLTSSILVGSLDDQSALVRRAAMVSLSEHFLNGFPLYDKSLVEKIFSKLGDPDVEVRREVSTLIPVSYTHLTRPTILLV